MNNFFMMGVIAALVAGAYFLIRILIALAKKQDKQSFIRGLGASAVAVVVCFAGFVATETPEQKARNEARIAAQKQAEAEQREAEEKAKAEKRAAEEKAAAEKAEADRLAAEEKRLAEEKARAEKAEAERQAAERKAQEEAQKKYDAMIKDITTGWNTATTDVYDIPDNWQKAVGVVYRYPDYIYSSADNWIDAGDALKSPWKYYGQVVNLSGVIYSIEQFPPGSELAKLFEAGCYKAMLDIGYGSQAAVVYIVGSADNVYDGSTVAVKGYIYGHSDLITGMGGKARGLSFIGVME